MIKKLLRKLIPKNIAGFLGLLQVALPLIRELIMVVIRLLAVLLPGKLDDELVAKVRKVFDQIEEVFVKYLKDIWL